MKTTIEIDNKKAKELGLTQESFNNLVKEAVISKLFQNQLIPKKKAKPHEKI
jgi:hypothetical protein